MKIDRAGHIVISSAGDGTYCPLAYLPLAMRYSFELIGGINLPDIHGTELPDDVTALSEAKRRAEHHNSQAQRRQGYDGHGQVRIRDETGRIVAEVPID